MEICEKYNIDEDIKRINAYVEYCKRHENCCNKLNTLEQKNMGENSISELYKWLFDVTSNTSDTKIKELKEYCIKEFLLKIKDNIRVNSKNVIEFDNFINSVISDLEPQKNEDNLKICNTDIVLISDNAKFVCIIENKIAAKIQADTNRTQIEKYKKETEDKYPDYYKAFVFICANDDYYPKCELTDKHCSKEYNGKYRNIKIEKLLYDNDYVILEHYNIVQILYNFLFENNKDLFENDILIPTYHFNDEVFGILVNKEANASEKIDFKSILEKENYKTIIHLLCQYIEYCELHRTTNKDNFNPYTKIINKKLLWNICCDIKEHSDTEWKNVEHLADELAKKECNDLKNIIEELNKK